MFCMALKMKANSPHNPNTKSKMVTDLFSCEIEIACYIWSWTQKGLHAETDCHLQSKLVLDSAFKGLCHLQESCFLILDTLQLCKSVDWWSRR